MQHVMHDFFFQQYQVPIKYMCACKILILENCETSEHATEKESFDIKTIICPGSTNTYIEDINP